MITVALYARVSSEKQAQENTIASQISELEDRINADGFTLSEKFKFIDNGYSGVNLVRPALEKLRDSVFADEIDKIYIHSPDRLSRKYVYQMILLEEFQKSGAEIIFLNCESNNSPESQLLLQMQGMIAEYEREKIIERNRRGRIHAARSGHIGVMTQAPYGYHYINKHDGGGRALYEIDEKQAEIIRKIFSWVGYERISIGEVQSRLNEAGVPTSRGKLFWNRSTIGRMLNDPAYKGKAAYGKRKTVERKSRLRPIKGACAHPKKNTTLYKAGKENLIYISVPAILDESLFDIVQEQLQENKKKNRGCKASDSYLLRGLVVCKHCNYAYNGRGLNKKEKLRTYSYYRCGGTMTYFSIGIKACDNKSIRSDRLEVAVWEEVKSLLKNPDRLLFEYQRRMKEIEKSPFDETSNSLEKQVNHLKRGISRLIDSYAQEHIDKEEFEPRIKAMKQHLRLLESEKKQIIDQEKLKDELQLILTSLECFAAGINEKLECIDWQNKRDIIRTLVKKIEISREEVNIVFRIDEIPYSSGPIDRNKNWQDCPSRSVASPIHSIFSSKFNSAFSIKILRLSNNLWHEQLFDAQKNGRAGALIIIRPSVLGYLNNKI